MWLSEEGVIRPRVQSVPRLCSCILPGWQQEACGGRVGEEVRGWSGQIWEALLIELKHLGFIFRETREGAGEDVLTGEWGAVIRIQVSPQDLQDRTWRWGETELP